ncbi:MAG: orotidine-5'-phosphate decarboxylase [Candidatus Omnitrophota bacterium]|jgi:orotidine-5'-phosphate decarboxylase
MSKRLIVALDTPTLEGARKLIKQLEGVVSYYKVGMELFTAHGWEAVKLVRKSGAGVFLDLKFHDIPTTVARTAAVVCDHDVDMFNIHTLGGYEMMRAVRKQVDECKAGTGKPLILGVTILTSHTEDEIQKDLGIRRKLQAQVLALAGLARKAGLDGVVCSPQEITMLRKRFPKNFVIVTPGVRPAGSETGDQKRTLTPVEAIQRGADYIVVGRPITASPDPRKSAINLLK